MLFFFWFEKVVNMLDIREDATGMVKDNSLLTLIAKNKAILNFLEPVPGHPALQGIKIAKLEELKQDHTQLYQDVQDALLMDNQAIENYVRGLRKTGSLPGKLTPDTTPAADWQGFTQQTSDGVHLAIVSITPHWYDPVFISKSWISIN